MELYINPSAIPAAPTSCIQAYVVKQMGKTDMYSNDVGFFFKLWFIHIPWTYMSCILEMKQNIETRYKQPNNIYIVAWLSKLSLLRLLKGSSNSVLSYTQGNSTEFKVN